MKRSRLSSASRCIAALTLALFSVSQSSAAVFTTDTVIAPADVAFENTDIVVSNATLTVDGPHTFANLLVGPGGVVTHTFSASGTIPTNSPQLVVDEPQILAGTNEVLLANSNILLASLVVKDSSGTITYQANTDYLGRVSGADTFLGRTESSTIPDGATVLVSYTIPAGTIPAGLNVSLTGNLEVSAGGFVNANGRGTSSAGAGASAGSPLSGSGGGHGGYGGLSSSNALGGNCYGVIQLPTTFGSRGGNGAGGLGAPGGGVIRLNVTGTAQIDGTISANGLNATNSRSGGGSGGSIWITAQTVSGAGAITAHGGNGEPIHGGDGGGGRIALQMETNVFSGALAAYGGSGWRIGGAGSVFTKLGSDAGVILFDNNNRAGANSLIANPNQSDIVIRARAAATVSGTWFARDVSVASNCVIGVSASSTTLNLRSLLVEANALVVADGAGFNSGQGTGVGGIYAGGAHGGAGGNSLFNNSPGGPQGGLGGLPHGNQLMPTTLGHWGGGTNSSTSSGGGAGGGAIRLNISSNLTLNGSISAQGRDGASAGGGAGGSIYITTADIFGSGVIAADGGNGHPTLGGGGGGGRIAIYATRTNQFNGPIRAYGGGGANRGGAGTVYLQIVAGPNSDELILDNGGLPAPNARSATTFGSVPYWARLVIRNGAAGQSTDTGILGSLLVGSNSSLSLASGATITGSALVEDSGVIHADGLASNFGSGNGFATFVSSGIYYCGGGGHGGYGGNGATTNARGGNSYGLALSPTSSGSTGGPNGTSPPQFGGVGGGALRLTVNGSLTNHGRISSQGLMGSGTYAGGGSGGSVWLTLGQLHGSGLISANGGPGILPGGGGGGGGRIAITYTSNFFTGNITAYGGSGANYGGAGTIYLKTNQFSAGQLIVDNGGNIGTNTTFSETSFSHDLTIARGGTLTFTATGQTPRNILIKTNGTLLTSQQFLTLSGNLTIDAGGLFSLDGRGNGPQTGPGAGSNIQNFRGGGGHGGYGAGNTTSGGNAYDSITSPSNPGSGGGGGPTSSPIGGPGGGAFRLQFIGNNSVLAVNGRLSANGLAGDVNAGGGSGGSLWLSPLTLQGSGVISANGGAANGTGGAGGGGRISINFTTNLFTGQITAFGGAGAVAGGAGTIYLKPNTTSVGPLLVDNGGQSGTNTPLSSVAFNLPGLPFNLTISGGASVFALTPLPQLSNLVINAASALTMRTNEINVSLDVLRNVTIAAGGAINVDGKGFGRGLGTAPGASLASKGAGGGHGGAGGNSQSGALGGTNYGSVTQPVLRGSGGGAGANIYISGSEGGGAIRMTVGGTLSVDGYVGANGNPGIQDDSGGGAGGSVWITAGRLIGAGAITATGGAGDLFGGGGGGGGRIAIYSPMNEFAGMFNVFGGTSANDGSPGTLFITTNLAPVLAISGMISTTNGLPVSGVLLQAVGVSGTITSTTDSNGNYLLEVPSGWPGGTVTPSFQTNVFLPSARSYNTTTFSVANQNFTMLPSVTPTASVWNSGTNLYLSWNGLAGVTYWPQWSTNLTEWWFLDVAIPGSNGVMQVPVLEFDAPEKFFRIHASY